LDGSVLDYALVPLSDGATLVQYWDVTDSIRIQRALQERAEALEQADRLKSEFIANVSYELRTPLNAIIGFSELLKMQVVGPMNAKQIDYAESLIAASTRLVTLVNDILDLASIEAGYLELDPARVDVRTLYEELMVLAQERSRSRNMVLEANVAPDSAVVVADPVRLKQALFNLVSNALQFTPGDGRILLTARREAGATVLEVSDTGVGIPDDIRTRVFESFERGASMGRSTGAGLGLALVERLIRLHGGEVTLRSDVGLGTVVSCWLPDRPELSERAAGDVEVSAPPST
jgi:signal transduction histidine kinase